MLSNLFGGYRYKRRRRRVSRRKRSRRRSRRSRKYSRKRRSYKNYVPYETAKYDRKSRKLKIYVGDGKFLEYRRMLKHMFGLSKGDKHAKTFRRLVLEAIKVKDISPYHTDLRDLLIN